MTLDNDLISPSIITGDNNDIQHPFMSTYYLPGNLYSFT